MAALDRSIALLKEEAVDEQWQYALQQLATDDQAAPLLRGFAVRLRYDRGIASPEETALALSQALSPAVNTHDAGAWFEGFMNEAGDVLIADQKLFDLVDAWICEQSGDDFVEMLPLLRRSFATFDPSASRRLLDRVTNPADAGAAILVDDPRAAAAFAAAVPLLKTILGVESRE